MEMEVRSNRTLIGRLTSYVEGKHSLLLYNLHIVNSLSTDDDCTCYLKMDFVLAKRVG